MTKLSREERIKFFNIFHQQHDEWAETKEGSIPTASFTAVVSMVEDYMGVTRTPVLDGSEMIGEETADEYLDRLVKKASPAWEGVDPEQFLNEVRGRAPEIEWKEGPPQEKGDYLISTKHWPHPSWEMYDPDSAQWDDDEVLFHVGPIPKPPHHV